MTSTFLIIAIIVAFIFGFIVVAKMDNFLKKDKKTRKKGKDSEEPARIMLTDGMTDEEIAREVQQFRKKHKDIRVVFYCGTDAELHEKQKNHIHGKR